MPGRNAFLLCILVSALLMAAVAVAQDLAALRKAAEQQATGEVAKLRDLGTFPMSKVLRLAVEQGSIRVRSDLPATSGQVRLSIEGMPGVTTAVVRDGGTAGQFLQLSHKRFDVQDAIVVQITLHKSAGQTSIIANWQFSNNSSRQVSLTQRDPGAFGGQIPPTFHILAYGVNNGMHAGQTNVQAGNLAALVREYPGEVELYVRPVLRMLQSEHVLAVDGDLALQVFGGTWTANAGTAKRVGELVAALEAESHLERDKAARQLAELGQEGALALMHVDRAGLTPQQKAIIESVLAPRQRVTPREAMRLAGDANFLLDCLYSQDTRIRGSAMKALERLLGRSAGIDADAELEVRAAAIDALRRQLTAGTTRAAGGSGGAD